MEESPDTRQRSGVENPSVVQNPDQEIRHDSRTSIGSVNSCTCYCHGDPGALGYVSPWNDRDEWIGCYDCACTAAEWFDNDTGDAVRAADLIATAMRSTGCATVGVLLDALARRPQCEHNLNGPCRVCGPSMSPDETLRWEAALNDLIGEVDDGGPRQAS